MAFYRGVNQALNTLRNNSRSRIILPKSPIPDSPPKITQIRGFIASNSPRFTGFSPNPTISRRIPDSSSKLLQIRRFIASNSARISRNSSISQRLSISPSSNPVLNIPRRYSHHKADAYNTKLTYPETVLLYSLLALVFCIGSVPLISVVYMSLPDIDLKRKIGDFQFKIKKSFLKHKILPETHPDSVKVKLISEKLIATLKQGLKFDNQCVSIKLDDSEKEKLIEALNHEFVSINSSDLRKIMRDLGKGLEHEHEHEDDLVDLGKNFEELDWEIMVVDEPDKTEVYCNPGGKIVVYTGLLKHLKSDEEIAAVIGHQIAHAVTSSHWPMAVWTWITVGLILWRRRVRFPKFKSLDMGVHIVANTILGLVMSQMIEKEADYVGMLLMASAGYDPKVAPRVWKMLGKHEFGGNSALKDWFSTRSSGKERARVLEEDRTRNKALMFYKKAGSGQVESSVDP